MADRSILAAAEWEPTLREALRSSKSVLLLMTPRSKASLWVAAEAGAAWVLQNSCVTGCYRMQTVTGLSYQGIELIGPSFLYGFIVN